MDHTRPAKNYPQYGGGGGGGGPQNGGGGGGPQNGGGGGGPKGPKSPNPPKCCGVGADKATFLRVAIKKATQRTL